VPIHPEICESVEKLADRTKGQLLGSMFYMWFGGGAALGWGAVIDAPTSFLECVVHQLEDIKPGSGIPLLRASVGPGLQYVAALGRSITVTSHFSSSSGMLRGRQRCT
jgi:hypothetical protein